MEEELKLARAKFEFLAKTYKQVSDNFEYLEKKAQLFFSFATIFLGAIILNSTFIENIREAIQNGKLGDVGNLILQSSLGMLIGFTLLSIIALASAIRGQYWAVEHPDNLAFEFYAPNSEFLEKQDELNFLNKIGYLYALAIEHNRNINSRKYFGLEIATWCIYISIFSMLIILTLLFFSQLT